MASALLRIVLFAALAAAPAAANTSGGLGKWALGKWGAAKQVVDPCSCENDTNGPVCHPGKMDYIADCAAQADCQGIKSNYVACASLRTVSWRHECSCRHRFVSLPFRFSIIATSLGRSTLRMPALDTLLCIIPSMASEPLISLKPEFQCPDFMRPSGSGF